MFDLGDIRCKRSVHVAFYHLFHRESHTFLLGINEITRLYCGPYDILRVKNAFIKSVYCIMEYTKVLLQALCCMASNECSLSADEFSVRNLQTQQCTFCGCSSTVHRTPLCDAHTSILASINAACTFFVSQVQMFQDTRHALHVT